MNSQEEDALFEQHGWYKNLIKRQYEAPDGCVLGFDDLVELTASPDGERRLVDIVRACGCADG